MVDKDKRGSRGGQGNEAGSVYRRGVGLVLATHGLVAKGIAALEISETGLFPVAIAFETLDAIDDIRCELSDGGRLYLQAKRSVGKDRAFTSTVEQWLHMIRKLNAGDRLVVVGAEFKGAVTGLPTALRKRRAGGVLTAPEKLALSTLSEISSLPEGSDDFDELCAVSYAWPVSAESGADLGYQLCAAMLDGVVVEASHGSAALSAMAAKLHSDAGVATRSTLSDWWTWLNNAKVPLIGSASGSAARRLTAERDAALSYRADLARWTNIIDFSVLSDALPPLTVSDLLSTVVVASTPDASSGYALPDMVRRYQDLVLVGHPGTGKSTAVRQLAAYFAVHDEAPMPIVVHLSRIHNAVRGPEDVTLELLINDAVGNVPAMHRQVMADIARRELTSGFAVLICDGLDECRVRASAVVDGMVQLKKQFGPNVGVLVTTRASALRPARRLGCQVMHLLAPTRVHQVQTSAARAAMDQLTLTDDERVRREKRLKQIQREHPAISSVPLLGNLIAVLVGLGSDSDLGVSAADLLEKVMMEALKRWEAARGPAFSGNSDSSFSKIDPELLWDGYVAIGHLIAESDFSTRSAATSAVAAKLRKSWGKADREAESLAETVVDFWDTSIAVFVEDGDGILSPRSRVFVDLADAVWMVEASQSGGTSWIDSVLADETRSDSVVLAVSKDPRFADLTIESVTSIDSRRVLVEWLCDAADRIELGEACVEAMLDSLIELAPAYNDCPTGPEGIEPELFWSQNAQEKKDGNAWPFVRRVAVLPLPPRLRAKRDALFAHVSADPERSATAAVLAATTDATYDSRPLSADECGHVTKLLALPLPEHTDRVVRIKRNSFSILPTEPILSGKPEAVLRAIQVLDELPQDVVDRLAEFTDWVPPRYARKIEAEIVRRGMSYSHTEKHAQKFQLPAIFDEPSALPVALIDIATPAEIEVGDAWWCREFFALYQLMEVGDAPALELRHLNTEAGKSALVGLARILCEVHDLDAATLASQVAYAAAQGDSALDAIETIAYRSHPNMPKMKSLSAINTDQREALRVALTSPCEWLGGLAFCVSRSAIDDELSAMLMDDLGTAHPRAQWWAAFGACHLATDPIAAAKRLASASVGARAAAARHLKQFGDTPEARILIGRFLDDEDLRVQLAAGYEGPVDATAKVWTCWACMKSNEIASEDCVHCTHGVRP